MSEDRTPGGRPVPSLYVRVYHYTELLQLKNACSLTIREGVSVKVKSY